MNKPKLSKEEVDRFYQFTSKALNTAWETGKWDFVSFTEFFFETKFRKVRDQYISICPFHKEKTGSFVYNPEKDMFFCFGCKAGGYGVSGLIKIALEKAQKQEFVNWKMPEE